MILCEKPFMYGAIPCSCSKCLACLAKRKRTWAGRLQLEQLCHDGSAFVTMTYADEYLPKGGNLVPSHLRDWLKRFRAHLWPTKIRYYAVGEYGEETKRPHYHAAIFGVDRWIAGGMDGMSGAVKATWSYGHSYVGDLSDASAAYVAGYVTKKLIPDYHGKGFLDGRIPEFQRMSLRPHGIGGGAIEHLARVLRSGDGLQSVARNGDVPFSLLLGGKSVSLGRYIRGKLREALNFTDGGKVPAQKIKEFVRETLPELRKEYELLAEGTEKSGQEIMLAEHAQKLRNVAARLRVHQQAHKI